MSQRTVQGYLRAVRQLADYCKGRPDQITEWQLQRSFLYLKNENRFAYGSLRVSLKVIQKYLGHSSLQTTRIYLHLTDTAEANARQAISRLFRRR